MKSKSLAKTNVVVVLRGPAGVGKSTISRIIQDKLGKSWAIIDVDKLKILPLKDDHSNRPERSEIAHETSHYLAKLIYDRGYDIIIEEMYKQRFNDSLVEFLHDNHMRYLKVFLAAPVDMVIDRSNRREKDVPEAEIRRHYSEIVPYPDDLVIDTDKHSSEEAADIIIKASVI